MAKKENLAFLNYLKAFAAIFVVIHHAATYSGLTETNNVVNFSYHFVSISVNALFFLISGYLCHSQKLVPYYTKKLTKILIPFVVFTSLKLIYGLVISDAHAHGASLAEQLYEAFVCGSLYWFIYAILVTYMISPLFWKLKRWNVLLLILAFGVFTVLDLLGIHLPDVLQLHFTLYHIGYFIAGYLLQLYGEKLSALARKHKTLIFFVCLAVISAFLCLRLAVVDDMPYFARFPTAFCLIYLLYLLAKKLPKNIEVLDFIGKHALQIMFFDSFFKVLLFAILKPTCGIHVALIITLNISLTCIACMVIKKIPYVRILFGL